MVKSISVIGIVKLGAPMSAGFAARGLRVKAVDLNPQKVDAMNRGVPPVHEPGLAELMKEAGSLLSATQNIGKRSKTPRLLLLSLERRVRRRAAFHFSMCCPRAKRSAGHWPRKNPSTWSFSPAR